MSKKKQAGLQQRIAELEIKKRSSMMGAIAAFIIMIVLIVLKLTLQGNGAEWANSTFANMAIFIAAIVLAGAAGIGTRNWNRARKEIDAIRMKLRK